MADKMIFYFGDMTEGTDTITDFWRSVDILKFAQPFSSSYTRDATATDSDSSGTTFNISASGNTCSQQCLILQHNLQTLTL